MKRILILGLVILTSSLCAGQWQPLFNGKDPSGWEQVVKGRMYVKDGLINTEGGMGLLWYTKEKSGNCTLRVVYRTTSMDDNSGVFIRLPETPKDPWHAVNTGYEVQILQSWPKDYEMSEHQKKYGTKWHTTGALYSIAPAEKHPQKPPGEWNTMEMVLDGPLTKVYLNGELVTRYREGDPVPPREHYYEPKRGRRPDFGYIGIQNHHEPQRVQFREISVKKKNN